MQHQATERNRWLRMKFVGAAVVMLAAVLLNGTMFFPAVAAAADDSDAVFFRGSGPIELIFFTDYFCPPCQKLETHLEGVLPDLMPLGVKIGFVDMPFSRLAPLYGRYFLYAAKAAPDLAGLLHARAVLVQVAQAKNVESDQEMIDALRTAGVPIQFFDIRPVLARWGEIIREHNVRSTPTGVLIRPGAGPEVFVGNVEIPEAIDRLMESLTGSPPDGPVKAEKQ